MTITVPKKCPLCYGHSIKVFKSIFRKMCKRKMKGPERRILPFQKEKNFISYDIKVCNQCEMGALVLSGEDLPDTENIIFIGE